MQDDKQPVSPDRQAGHPGTGARRRDEPGKTGIYPYNTPNPPDDAEQEVAGRWGQQPTGSYQDHGGSEPSNPGGERRESDQGSA